MARAHQLTERSGEDAASLAGRAMNGETLTQDQVKTLAASVLSQRQIPVDPQVPTESATFQLPPPGTEEAPTILLHLHRNGRRRTLSLPIHGESTEIRDFALWLLAHSP